MHPQINCIRFSSSSCKYNKRFHSKNIIERINKIMPQNPFHHIWNKVWSFHFYLEGETPKIEVNGLGITMTTGIKKAESPSQKVDRLVFKEQQNRKSRYHSWIKTIN